MNTCQFGHIVAYKFKFIKHLTKVLKPLAGVIRYLYPRPVLNKCLFVSVLFNTQFATVYFKSTWTLTQIFYLKNISCSFYTLLL